MNGREKTHEKSTVVITMVPGTFDQKARWTERNSPIPKRLCGVFEDCVQKTLPWLRKNSEVDRNCGVLLLIDHVKKLSVDFPNAPHILIGHSHGGNIIRNFILSSSAEVNKCIAGAATVSTPFLYSSPREFADNVRALSTLWRFSVVITICLTWLVFYRLHYVDILTFIGGGEGAWLILLLLPLYLVFVLAQLLFGTMDRIVLKNLHDHQAHINSSKEVFSKGMNVLVSLPFLCITSKLDEVAVLFSSSATFLRIWNFLTGLVLSLQYLLFYSMLRGFIWSSCLLAAIMFSTPGSSASEVLMATFPLFSTVACMGATIGVSLAMAIGVRIYGFDRARDLLVMNFDSRIHPKGLLKSRLLSVRPSFGKVDGKFASCNMHTGILYTDQVAEVIAQFALDCVKNFPGAALKANM